MTVLERLEPIMRDLIAPQAMHTDRSASYPRDALQALGQVGLLGLISNPTVGGLGHGLPEAVQVVERIAQDCPCTAMVLTMHYCGTAYIEPLGPLAVRQAIAAGEHITTLAVSETATRSHIWAMTSEAAAQSDGRVLISGEKSMITSAGQADSYVWTTRAMQGQGNTLWLLNAKDAGFSVPRPFDGLGLRGNHSAPISAQQVPTSLASRLGDDGQAEPLKAQYLMPYFATLIATTSIGLMQGILRRAIAHITASRFAESGSALADLPTIRAYLAKAQLQADQARLLRDDTVAAVLAARADKGMRLLQVKAAAAEAALQVSDTAMRICGGAAFRKELGIERLFRDARAACVMAPTSDVLFDKIGTLLCDSPTS